MYKILVLIHKTYKIKKTNIPQGDINYNNYTLHKEIIIILHVILTLFYLYHTVGPLVYINLLRICLI